MRKNNASNLMMAAKSKNSSVKNIPFNRTDRSQKSNSRCVTAKTQYHDDSYIDDPNTKSRNTLYGYDWVKSASTFN